MLAVWDEQNLMNYVSWRYNTTDNFADSISGEISGIISTFNKYEHRFQIDRKKFSHLRHQIKGIKTEVGRYSDGKTHPIRTNLLIQIFKIIPNSYNGTVLKFAFSLAKHFMLRSGDYSTESTKPNVRTLKFKNFRYFIFEGEEYLQITMKFGKNNRFHKTEILTRKCTCHIFNPIICVVHCYLTYFNMRKDLKNDVFSFDHVFKWYNNKLITTGDLSANLYFYLEELNICLDGHWKLHSFRWGGITDLRKAGVPDWIIRKIARHSPNSETTFYYTSFKATEEADEINKNLKNLEN